MRELYINNQLCDIDDAFQPTFQFKSFLFAKMQGYESPRSWTVSIPLTARNRAILKQSQAADSTELTPYLQKTVSYYSDGYPIIEEGIAYQIGISNGRADFVFLIDQQYTTHTVYNALKELKLTEIAESSTDALDWNTSMDFDDMSAGYGWVNWYSYTNEDRSLVGTNANLPYSVLHPVVTFGWILDKIAAESSYVFTGLNSVRNYVLPISRADGISQGLTQSALAMTLTYTNVTDSGSNTFTDVIGTVPIPLVVIPNFDGIGQLRLHPSTFASEATTVRLVGQINVILLTPSTETDLVFRVNGALVGGATATNMGAYFKYDFDVSAQMSIDDSMTILFDGHNIQSEAASSHVNITFPDFANKSMYGLKFFIIPNLPDITMLDFINQCCQLAGVFPYVSPTDTGTLNFYSTKVLYDNLPTDYSQYLLKETDTMGQPEHMEYTVEGFAQSNMMLYAADEGNSMNVNSQIVVSNQSAEPSSNLFQLAFGAARRFAPSNTVADYPLYDITVVDGIVNRNPIKQSLSVIGAVENRSGVNYLVFPDAMTLGYIKLTEPYQYLQGVLSLPNVLTERFKLSALLTSQIDVRKPVYLKQYGQYYAILEAQVDADYNADITLLRLPYITPITSNLTFAAYSNTNVTYYVNSVAVPTSGATFTFDSGTNISITAVPASGYTAEIYFAVGYGSETKSYLPFTTVITSQNIAVRGVVSAATPVTTDVIVAAYSWTNGTFTFAGALIPQSGTTYTIPRNSQSVINATAATGFKAQLLVGGSPVTLPYTLTALAGEYNLTPSIVADSGSTDKTITIGSYTDSYGVIYLKYDDIDHPVSPAGASFTLPYGKYFYLWIDVTEPTKTTTINLGGGIIISDEYYEDTLTSNMNITITFIEKEIPITFPEVFFATNYDGSKGSLYVDQIYYAPAYPYIELELSANQTVVFYFDTVAGYTERTFIRTDDYGTPYAVGNPYTLIANNTVAYTHIQIDIDIA